MKKRIALAGNPNSGKTSLFNDLTGANQYVGNWAGVTVDRKGGELKEHEEIEIQDLPGTYSLSPFSPEEMVSRRYLLEEKPDMVVNVVDSTNLERNLYLTSQILETGLPVVIALNMIDLLEERGESIDTDALSRQLGCPVVKVSAITHVGIPQLIECMLGEPPAPGKPLHYVSRVEEAISTILSARSCTRFEAVKLLEGDESMLAPLSKTERHSIEDQRMEVETALGDDIASIIAGGRYDAICSIIPQIYTRRSIRETFTQKADKVLTHRVFGPIIFVAIMYAIYYLSINTIGAWGTDWANDVLFGPVVKGWLAGFIGNEAAGVEALTMFSAVLGMVLVFPTMLRRLHDMGMNGAWLYIVIAPFLLEYMCPHLPSVLHTGLMWLLMAANAVLLGLCVVRPGQAKANNYGSKTREFARNPLKMTGRGSRREFNTWFIVMSLLTFAITWLGRSTLNCSPQLQSIITDGIVAGVGAVLGFLPQMAVLFFLMALLEDCGYMARVAFMLDRIFRSIGLSGKSVIPLMVSMGCGVPGVMATRTIENEKDRRMTVMLTTFVPCGAKLPILALIGAMIGQTATIATVAYFVGFGSVILGGLMLRKTHMFAGSYTPFVMELPTYHIPHGANINLRAMERCKAFVKKAGTVIFLASAIIWVFSNYNWSFTYLPNQKNLEGAAINHSMLADTGNTFAPIFEPLGWGDWKPAVATVTGLIAKENVVGTMGVLYPATSQESDDTEAAEENTLPRTGDICKANALTALTILAWQFDGDVRNSAPAAPAAAETEDETGATTEEADNQSWLDYLNAAVARLFPEVEETDETCGVAGNVKAAGAFSAVSALSFMLFNILCAPCFAACGAIRREMNSARWTTLAISFMTLWAYAIAFMVYQLGLWVTEGAFSSGQIAACVLAAVILYMIIRPNPYASGDED